MGYFRAETNTTNNNTNSGVQPQRKRRAFQEVDDEVRIFAKLIARIMLIILAE
jgi:hypothetical protein